MSKYDRDEIIDMRRAGHSWTKIAAHYGVTRAPLMYAVGKMDLPADARERIARPASIVQFDREQVIAARRAKVTWRQIAEQAGRSYGALTSWLKTQDDLPEDIFVKLGRPLKVTPEEMEEMVRGWGWSDAEIANHLGISRAAAQNRRARLGVRRREHNVDNRHRTPEELANAEALIDEGYSFRAIEGMTGIASSTLRRHFPGRAYTPEQVQEAISLHKRMYHLEKRMAA